MKTKWCTKSTDIANNINNLLKSYIIKYGMQKFRTKITVAKPLKSCIKKGVGVLQN